MKKLQTHTQSYTLTLPEARKYKSDWNIRSQFLAKLERANADCTGYRVQKVAVDWLTGEVHVRMSYKARGADAHDVKVKLATAAGLWSTRAVHAVAGTRRIETHE